MMKPAPLKQDLANLLGTKLKTMTAIVKNVYRVQASNGKQYALKRVSSTQSKTRWIDTTLILLRQNGFSRMAWRNPQENAGRQLIYKLRGRPYILTPWISGRWASPQSRSDMCKCGISLAQFHQASRRFHIPSKGAVNNLGSWPKELKKKQTKIEERLRKADKGGYKSPLDAFLQKHGDQIMGYCQEAKRLLKSSNYKKACNRAQRSKSLCHGDGGPTNFIMNNKGTFLIDFETLRIDLPAYDLYRVIYNSCKDHQWDFNIAKAILDGYQSVSKLKKSDIELMKVWLRYPRTTDLLLNEYERAKSRKASIQIAKQLGSALAAEQKVSRFLRQLDAYRLK